MDPHGLKSLPFNHPDVRPIFDSVLNTILAESDRGAVLVAAAVVDSYLEKLFDGTAPSTVTNDDRKRLFRYPGPLSSFGARSDVALATRLIPLTFHRSINLLRKIRNDVAHSPTSFRLDNHVDRLREMYNLGPNISQAINRLAAELLIKGFVTHILEDEAQLPPEEQSFRTPAEVLDYLKTVPEAVAHLQDKAYRLELGVAVALLCAGIVLRRDEIVATLGPDALVGRPLGKEAA